MIEINKDSVKVIKIPVYNVKENSYNDYIYDIRYLGGLLGSVSSDKVIDIPKLYREEFNINKEVEDYIISLI